MSDPSPSIERNDATGALAAGGAWQEQPAVMSKANAPVRDASVGARAALRLEISVASGLLLALAAFFIAVGDSRTDAEVIPTKLDKITDAEVGAVKRS